MNNKKTQIYTKDKTMKISFRCDTSLAEWVASRSDLVGLTPSAFVRQNLYQQMYAEKTLGEALSSIKSTASTETAAKKCKQIV